MKIRTFLTTITALAAASCGNTVGPGATNPERVLLEIEYVNYAWTPTYFGFVVEVDGEVYKYDRKGEPWGFEKQSSWITRELRDKFALNRELVQTRSAAEIEGIANKVDAVPSQPLSTRRMQCADAGVLTYRAYKYDVGAGRYTAVLLRAEGDVAQLNTSSTAQELIVYIRSLGLIEELPGCDP